MRNALVIAGFLSMCFASTHPSAAAAFQPSAPPAPATPTIPATNFDIALTDHDGSPLASVPVVLSVTGPEDREVLGVTDAAGRVRISVPLVEIGRYAWWLRLADGNEPGVSAEQRDVVRKLVANRERLVELQRGVASFPAASPVEIAVQLRRRAVLSGRVELVTPSGSIAVSADRLRASPSRVGVPVAGPNGLIRLSGVAAVASCEHLLTYRDHSVIVHADTSSGEGDWGLVQFYEIPADAGSLDLTAANLPGMAPPVFENGRWLPGGSCGLQLVDTTKLVSWQARIEHGMTKFVTPGKSELKLPPGTYRLAVGTGAFKILSAMRSGQVLDEQVFPIVTISANQTTTFAFDWPQQYSRGRTWVNEPEPEIILGPTRTPPRPAPRNTTNETTKDPNLGKPLPRPRPEERKP